MKRYWRKILQYGAMNLSAAGVVIILWNIWAAYGMLDDLTLAKLLVGLFICAAILFRCTFSGQSIGASVLDALAITLTGWILHRLAILEEKSLIAGFFLFVLLILLTHHFYGKTE